MAGLCSNISACVFIVLVAFFCGCRYKPDQALNKSGVVCSPGNIDLGDIDPVSTPEIDVVFEFLNTTKVNISGVKVGVSCGCLVPSEFPSVLSPGISEKLKIKLAVPADPGRIAKKVSVRFGEGDAMTMTMAIVGRVLSNPLLQAYPETVDFGSIIGDAVKTRVITVARIDKSPVSLTSIECHDKAISARLLDGSNPDESSIAIEVAFDPKRYTREGGELATTLTLKTNTKSANSLSVPMVGRVRPQFESPFCNSIFFPMIPMFGSSKKPIFKAEYVDDRTIRQSNYRIKSYRFSGSNELEVELVEESSGTHLKVTRTGNCEAGNQAVVLEGSLVIELDVPAAQEYRIPIRVLCFDNIDDTAGVYSIESLQ